MKTKFIEIKQTKDEQFEGKPVYRIYNNKSGDQLGVISFYKPWRKYIFHTQEGIVFDIVCLSSIVQFMTDLK